MLEHNICHDGSLLMPEETHSCQPTANENGDESGNVSRELVDNLKDSAQHSDKQHETRDAAYLPSVSILEKLPAEVLYNIFDNFSAPGKTPLSDLHADSFRNADDWNGRQSAVKSARLVCRIFNQLASPLLFPYIAIAIDQHSLDLVEKVSNQPHLAVGVRGIHITPLICSQLSASSFDFFKNDVIMMMKSLTTCLTIKEKNGNGFKDQRMTSACKSIISIYAALVEEFDDILAESDELYDLDIVEDYQNLILGSFTAYNLRYSEQCFLIKDGLYIEKLVTSLSRMPYLHSVEFDKLDNGWEANPETLLTDRTKLERHISTECLLTAHDDPMEDDTTVVSFFSGLPIAAYAAGIRLRHLYIGTFPTPGRIDVLSCEGFEMYTKEEAQEKLRIACQTLESLTLQVHVWNEDGDGYATALTASPHLQSVELITDGGPVSPEDIIDDPMAMFSVLNVLSTAVLPRLQRLKLYYVSFTQEGFETFCDNLGTEIVLWDVTLVCVYLTSGTWAGVVDRLRDIAKKPRARKFVVELSDLMGGWVDEESEEEDQLGSMNEDSGASHGPHIATLAEQYIMGYPDVKANPFRRQFM